MANRGSAGLSCSDGGGLAASANDQQHRAEYLGPPDVACVSRAQLHQSRDPMLYRLPPLPIGRERRAALEGAGLLEERLLGMETYRVLLVRSHPNALCLQRIRRADRGVKAELPQS